MFFGYSYVKKERKKIWGHGVHIWVFFGNSIMKIRKKWLNQLKNFFNKHFKEYYLASFCLWIPSSCEKHCNLLRTPLTHKTHKNTQEHPTTENNTQQQYTTALRYIKLPMSRCLRNFGTKLFLSWEMAHKVTVLSHKKKLCPAVP